MEFELGVGCSQKLIVLRHSKMIIVCCNAKCAEGHKAGLYVPLFNSQWNGRFQYGTQQCSFDTLLEYLDESNKTFLDKAIKPFLNCRYSCRFERLMELEFDRASALLDSTFVEFAKLVPFITDNIRLVQSRIRNNPRRLALASACHTRLGHSSLLRLLPEEILISIVWMSCPFISFSV